MTALTVFLLVVIAVLMGIAVALLYKLLQRPSPLTRDELPATLDPRSLAETERRLAEQLAQRFTQLEVKEDVIARAQREELAGAFKSRSEENARLLETHLREVRESLKAMGGVNDGIQRLGEGVRRFNALLSNVKTRGVWGEVQLERLLSELFVAGQFEKNVKPNPRSNKIVEFALKLPGAEEGKSIWLPIDSKFPLDAYDGVQAAMDATSLESAKRALADRVKLFSTQVAQYITPPYTTDFAIMFVPVESIFLEVAADAALQDELRRKQIVFAGPQTMAVILNALQMGFKTLAVQRQSSKVWELLTKAKKDIDEYLSDCDAVAKKLDEAAGKVSSARHRIDMLSKHLRSVTIPDEETPHA
ncbi:MAG: DNA recombination protein RmuC [Kiritimatiellae bacterium]|nr:DNA recombination protein RmuC [Kiritimatiellia bacterium]